MEKTLRVGGRDDGAILKNLDLTFLCRFLYTITQGNPSTV